MKQYSCDIAIIGAGIVGIATAYYLKKLCPNTSVLLLDASQPMALTSAQSGENYRNWWPHPVMTAFTDRSIDLMESLATDTNNTIQMNRRGYALSTRHSDIDKLMNELVYGYSELDGSAIREHKNASSSSYQKPLTPHWQSAPSGVDVLQDAQLIQQTFPSYSKDIKTVVHIRRAGAISAQQMGQLMLQRYKAAGGLFINANVIGIEKSSVFKIHTNLMDVDIRAERVVNAAGPFINDVADMLGASLPVTNTLQQKIAFEDAHKVIPRDMPFSIDLDSQMIDWSDDELKELAGSEEYEWLTKEMLGSIHCRPDGGDKGGWIKLGWAYNEAIEQPKRDAALFDSFPEIVLRGAARLNPSLKKYYGRLPKNLHHYGGYYTLTDENWPLIGAMAVDGVFVVGAMSGFGTMAACAAGDLCARVMLAADVPSYAEALSPQRYHNDLLMNELRNLSLRGIL